MRAECRSALEDPILSSNALCTVLWVVLSLAEPCTFQRPKFARSKAWAVVQGRGEADAKFTPVMNLQPEMLHDLENSAEFQGNSMKLILLARFGWRI